jgi:hypothetical protein
MSYAEEKAAAEARKQARWAEAEAEFTAWYQDVGTRAEKTTKGNAGANYGKVITTLPKCWCGKATTALGMCINHYVHWYRQKTGRIGNGKHLRNQAALCHPDRTHHGKGLCKPCYTDLPETKARIKATKLVRDYLDSPVWRGKGRRKAWLCPHTDRWHKGRGVCNACYLAAWKKDALPSKPPRPRRCKFHHDRTPYARGMCRSCYFLWLRRRKDVKAGIRTRTLRLPGMPLKCGHDRPHYCRDLCRDCYFKSLTQRRRVAPRDRKHRKAGLPNLCGHPERKHYAHGCCGSCYKKKAWKRPGFGLELALAGAA